MNMKAIGMRRALVMLLAVLLLTCTLAITAAAEAGIMVTAFGVMKYLFYPMLLLLSSLVAIFLAKEKKA